VIVVFGHDERDADSGAAPLASGLRDIGETVVLAPLSTSADVVADVLAAAEEQAGPLDAVVLSSAGAATTEQGDLAGLDPVQWRDRVETPLERSLACFQGAHRRLRPRGGCLVVLVPTLSLVGAAGFVTWAAVAEGQRSLAKAAARAWGSEGIRVNCVAVPGALLSSPFGHHAEDGGRPGPEDRGLDRPGLPAPALPGPALRAQIAPVVASLVGGSWRAVTGATIAVDGGVWMTP
jgi:NAD(P)-dependent dehydrogenase (short-subunit alcohol dehydrogenase family)